jgi:hypothetical protein
MALPEPVVGNDGVEQVEALLHSVHGGLFIQGLVIFTGGGKEHHHEDVIKHVDPLLPLVPLATHVDHLALLDEPGMEDKVEAVLDHAAGPDTDLQDVLHVGDVVGVRDPSDVR